jgi:hypothetical protein
MYSLITLGKYHALQICATAQINNFDVTYYLILMFWKWNWRDINPMVKQDYFILIGTWSDHPG